MTEYVICLRQLCCVIFLINMNYGWQQFVYTSMNKSDGMAIMNAQTANKYQVVRWRYFVVNLVVQISGNDPLPLNLMDSTDRWMLPNKVKSFFSTCPKPIFSFFSFFFSFAHMDPLTKFSTKQTMPNSHEIRCTYPYIKIYLHRHQFIKYRGYISMQVVFRFTGNSMRFERSCV